MTYVEAYKSTRDWKRRAYLIATFHNVQLFHNKNWRLTDSARYFQISIGAISEFLTLNEKWDLIKHCHSKNSALKKVKNEI